MTRAMRMRRDAREQNIARFMAGLNTVARQFDNGSLVTMMMMMMMICSAPFTDTMDKNNGAL